DFGIGGIAAKQELARRTGSAGRGDLLASKLRGSHTPLYASPQQARGEPPDPRDDVFALGVIWYQLLMGDLRQAPGADYAADLQEVGVPAGVVTLLGQCIASRPDRRLPDATALEQLLRALTVAPGQAPDRPDVATARNPVELPASTATPVPPIPAVVP